MREQHPFPDPEGGQRRAQARVGPSSLPYLGNPGAEPATNRIPRARGNRSDLGNRALEIKQERESRVVADVLGRVRELCRGLVGDEDRVVLRVDP